VPVLAAAVVLACALGLLNLTLSIGVIRRLREHSQRLIDGSIGTGVTTTVGGERTARDALTDDTLVGFFTPNCAPCDERLPLFVSAATDLPRGRRQAIAVIVGPAETCREYVSALSPVAQVVVEEPEGVLVDAFGVGGFPATCRLDEHGVIRRSGGSALHSVSTVPA
jgi:hypothetical protein